MPDLRDLQTYVGRRCVYIEDRTFCVAQVVSVTMSKEGMSAVLMPVPGSPLVHHLREARFEEEGAPFGERWEIGKDWSLFFLSENYWDGSLYGGFRVLFAPEVVEGFLRRDLGWMDDYF